MSYLNAETFETTHECVSYGQTGYLRDLRMVLLQRLLETRQPIMLIYKKKKNISFVQYSILILRDEYWRIVNCSIDCPRVQHHVYQVFRKRRPWGVWGWEGRGGGNLSTDQMKRWLVFNMIDHPESVIFLSFDIHENPWKNFRFSHRTPACFVRFVIYKNFTWIKISKSKVYLRRINKNEFRSRIK